MLDTPYDTSDEFIKGFVQFSEKYRTAQNVSLEEEFWPLEKLYLVLEDSKGGFILDTGNHACLGLQVLPVRDKEGWYTVKYRDPFKTEPQKLQLDARKLITDDARKVKIQWFGKFDFLKEFNLNPGFSKLVEFRYEMILPKEHKKLVQKDGYRCGDISAYLAKHSRPRYIIPSNYSK